MIFRWKSGPKCSTDRQTLYIRVFPRVEFIFHTFNGQIFRQKNFWSSFSPKKISKIDTFFPNIENFEVKTAHISQEVELCVSNSQEMLYSWVLHILRVSAHLRHSVGHTKNLIFKIFKTTGLFEEKSSKLGGWFSKNCTRKMLGVRNSIKF